MDLATALRVDLRGAARGPAQGRELARAPEVYCNILSLQRPEFGHVHLDVLVSRRAIECQLQDTKIMQSIIMHLAMLTAGLETTISSNILDTPLFSSLFAACCLSL